MRWPLVTRGRYERELEQAGTLAKTLGSMVQREYNRAWQEGRQTAYDWAADALYKVDQLGGNYRQQLINVQNMFNPTPPSALDIIHSFPKVGDTSPSPWVRQLAQEIDDENRRAN